MYLLNFFSNYYDYNNAEENVQEPVRNVSNNDFSEYAWMGDEDEVEKKVSLQSNF